MVLGLCVVLHAVYVCLAHLLLGWDMSGMTVGMSIMLVVYTASLMLKVRNGVGWGVTRAQNQS